MIKSKHDDLIREFIASGKYSISVRGDIYSKRTGKRIGFTRPNELKLRRVGYEYVRYKGVELKVHRIIYQMYVGELRDDRVIHHIDGNSLNNLFSNLELTTHKKNVRAIYKAA